MAELKKWQEQNGFAPVGDPEQDALMVYLLQSGIQNWWFNYCKDDMVEVTIQFPKQSKRIRACSNCGTKGYVQISARFPGWNWCCISATMRGYRDEQGNIVPREDVV